ncbi:hypothetical protein OG21DRAFT_684566 [Imleria badia]|nr:hypothetical protein OG21DRAFT_684566 [Imleria badia]
MGEDEGEGDLGTRRCRVVREDGSEREGGARRRRRHCYCCRVVREDEDEDEGGASLHPCPREGGGEGEGGAHRCHHCHCRIMCEVEGEGGAHHCHCCHCRCRVVPVHGEDEGKGAGAGAGAGRVAIVVAVASCNRMDIYYIDVHSTLH